SEVLALKGDDHLGGDHQGVDAEEAERRGAVDDGVVELGQQRGELLLEHRLAAKLGHQLQRRQTRSPSAAPRPRARYWRAGSPGRSAPSAAGLRLRWWSAR